MELHPVDDIMDEDVFWRIIEIAHDNVTLKPTEDFEAYCEMLNNAVSDELKRFHWKEIIAFYQRFELLMANSYRDDLWCGAYIINGGCSDDGFDYFRCWLISLGKTAYYQALENVDNLKNYVSPSNEYYDNESFYLVAPKAFNQKTGEDLYEYLGERTFTIPAMEFSWSEYEPESMRAICPTLYQMYDENQ